MVESGAWRRALRIAAMISLPMSAGCFVPGSLDQPTDGPGTAR